METPTETNPIEPTPLLAELDKRIIKLESRIYWNSVAILIGGLCLAYLGVKVFKK